MNRFVNSISGRLSLRQPQRASLEILSRVCEVIPPDKGRDIQTALDVIKSEYPHFGDFERDFPSLCFALATGVGKTRLMGAFIAYLALAEGVRHFFVLAPNLTIYNKLIKDFTPNTPKYVFQGIAEFALNSPAVITGDNYESGRAIRQTTAQTRLDIDTIDINIFNISKINSEVRGGAAPRIKRLSEYIGQSYFDYLAGLDDLVLLMDESHRYRATAGVRAVNELRPILGLELTATPQTEAGGKAVPFRNVVYSYPLSSALNDGFVKTPKVATRENFNANAYTPDALERLKLEDGVRVHEDTKVALEVYARQNDKPIVKPFMLVVARDTVHANELEVFLQEETFFNGHYKNRVITVHSNKPGAEADDVVEKLLSVEDPKNPVEIVVHVNMLKEGWDVTNLYTIVPLRAANSRTLVEQSIGRGLRLPYGRRTGVPAVDRLTIVAHDRFQEIIDEANKPDSLIKIEAIYIGRDIAVEPKQPVVVEPIIVQAISAPTQMPAVAVPRQVTMNLTTPEEVSVAKLTYEAIKQHERLPSSAALTRPETAASIIREVKAAYGGVQPGLEGIAEAPDFETIVPQVLKTFTELTIDIPRITVVPVGEVTSGYHDFDLDTNGINPPPVAADVILHDLHTNERERLITGNGGPEERRVEDYIIRALIDKPDISYDEAAELLYKLAGQMVEHLRSYLATEDDVINVARHQQQMLANAIHAQMQQHSWQTATAYEGKVSRGFETLTSDYYSATAGEIVRDFRTPVEERLLIRGMRFGGFRKCLYPEQKFESDSERRMAIVLEDDVEVLKWIKPAIGKVRIDYSRAEAYNPDFIVETHDRKCMCEPKRADQLNDPVTQAKAKAAATWCRYASEHAEKHGDKPWAYLLIPHDQITADKTIRGLAATYTYEDFGDR